MTSSSNFSERVKHRFGRVAMLFSGGPAPAANAVISTAAVSFLRAGVEVIGIRHGYSRLMEYSEDNPLQEGRDYINISHATLQRTRNKRGVLLGTARANPGKNISSAAHLENPERIAPMQTVYAALRSIGVEALISIGGDDTLKTANKFKMFQERDAECDVNLPVVHVPKTIDNDYAGIDFTFGYFTAVETLAEEIRNVLADAESDSSYFVVETMGRSAGWLSYGAAIAGEASLVISVEDIIGDNLAEEAVTDPETGDERIRPIMNVDGIVKRIVRMMQSRDTQGKSYGVIVLAEGLAEYLPAESLEGVPRDAHGHIAVADLDLGKTFAKLVQTEYQKQTGSNRRVKGLQLGYESRCARPTAFDVMLGSQLGVGAYRALVEEGKNGVMVSVSGQLDLHYVDFDSLIDPETLVTVVRFIDPDSDFYQLARFLESDLNL